MIPYLYISWCKFDVFLMYKPFFPALKSPQTRIKPSFYFSKLFIVGNTLLAFSSAFIMRRLVQNLRFSQYFCNLFPPYRVVLPRSVRGKSCRKVVKSCSGPESARIWHKIGTHRMPRKLPKTIPHYCELETTWFHTTLLTWTDLYRNKYSISREDVQVNADFVTELNIIPYI